MPPGITWGIHLVSADGRRHVVAASHKHVHCTRMVLQGMKIKPLTHVHKDLIFGSVLTNLFPSSDHWRSPLAPTNKNHEVIYTWQ